MTINTKVTEWVSKIAELCKPEDIVWIDGNKSQIENLRNAALASGELIALNQEKLPGCYLHRSAHNDVARSEDKTFICTTNPEDAGATNNWQSPDIMYGKLEKLFDGSMQGRTMYVIPFCMGPVGSPFSKLGVEITDSIYVVLNMHIMTRVSTDVIKMLDDLHNMGKPDDFVKCLHSKAQLDLDNRYICHFPEDNAIWSINSGYGGNALLGKKCLALRIASYQAKQEGWLAEHMLIIGVENPQGEVNYICAAFPSACGKTNLAMLIPPEIYEKKGYKIWCVGDDIAWLRIGEDGRLWAINPENGFFGVVPGTNQHTNPNALASISRDTIYTNVAYNEDDGTVWWEGLDNNPPENGIDWKGNKWNGKTSSEKGAHPNSRFTASAKNCPNLSAEFENPNGVPVSAIIFGGRRAKTTPLVYQARDFAHGVFVGSVLASETTAAQTGAVGVVRLDSMAMKPFCGYNMGDYLAHWLEMGKNLKMPPEIFNVNWFRTDENGFIWHGFGENLRVLEWVLERCKAKEKGEANEKTAKETPIGYMPRPENLNLEDLDISAEKLQELLHIDKEIWQSEVAVIRDYYQSLGDALPKDMWDELAKLEERLK
ncbi:MAG: phosphoenolpyruvate carboxykinase (GTP) [Defluviitaleaceae bacterium]|nr:phosphoenolpyruvate carboxykinase (GTP) [Defluviitaleaceae bacterium]